MEEFEVDNDSLTSQKKNSTNKGNNILNNPFLITCFLVLLGLSAFFLTYNSNPKEIQNSPNTFASDKTEKVLAINGKVIKEIYTTQKAIEDSKKAFQVMASGQYKCPPRTFLSTKNQDLTLMPASVKDKNEENLAVKILSIVPENRKRGLPLIPGKLLLFNEETGFLKALMDGGMITNLRTGATAGATASVLHPAKAENVVIFGCGAQGTYGLDSILTVHPEVKKVTCVDYFPEVAESYTKNHIARKDGRQYFVGKPETLEAAVREADIIHCATTSKESLFKAEWVKDGAHISAIGCYTLEMRELPIDIFKRSNVKLYVDQYEAMKDEAGDVMAAIREGHLKEENIKLFGDIMNGNDKGRTEDKQITIAKFVGVAPQDIIAAKTIYELAVEKGVGTKIDF